MQHQKKKNKGTRSIGRPDGGGADDGEVMLVGAEAMIEDPAAESGGTGETDGKPAGEAAGDAPPEDAAPEDAAAEAPAPAAKSELEALREERDSYLDLARRERADFDNYRKRVQREMAEMKRASLSAFLKEFFGPLDDMDRVLVESGKNRSFDALVQGVRIMEENFWRAFAKAGVKRIDAKGRQFDPNLHEAMTAIPSADVPPNTVLEVFENGYKLDEFILRPARVIVSRAPDAE